jgi:hypothetical protein
MELPESHMQEKMDVNQARVDENLQVMKEVKAKMKAD